MTPVSAPEFITPDMAAAWLEHNPINRPLNPNGVAQWARAIAAGEWDLNGESIKFDVHGRLLDGQHRLQAVVKTGIPIRTFVTRGLPPETQRTVDTGKKRTPGQVLSIEGIPNYNDVAAAARIALAWTAGVSIVTARFETYEIQDFVAAHPDLAPVVSEHRRGYPLSKSVSGFCAWALLRVDADAASSFLADLRSGANLCPGSPVLALRHRLATFGGQPRKLRTDDQIACVFRAWNTWRRGARLDKIQLTYQDGRVVIPALLGGGGR